MYRLMSQTMAFPGCPSQPCEIVKLCIIKSLGVMAGRLDKMPSREKDRLRLIHGLQSDVDSKEAEGPGTLWKQEISQNGCHPEAIPRLQFKRHKIMDGRVLPAGGN